MKNLTLALLAPILALTAHAAEFQSEGYFVEADGGNFRGYIIAATDTQVRYKTTSVATAFKDAKLSAFTTIFVVTPTEYTEALDLYEAGKYQEAQEKFRVYKEFSKPIAPLKGNYHTLSAFYEMECMRKLGDLEGLAAALKNFAKAPLADEYNLRQVDLYIMWDAVRTESWERVLTIASELDEKTIPGYQRAQIGYCKGLALQKLNRPSEALTYYSVATTADAGASKVVANKAALNSLQIYAENEDAKFAASVWGTPEENANPNGRAMLQEASALATEYDKLFSLGEPLPAQYKEFLKYGN